MLHTPICDLLGIELPLFNAPMGPAIASPELAAAVSNAGGLGMISFGGYPPKLLRQRIRRVRELTTKPFAMNFIGPLAGEEQIAVAIDERVPVLSFYWGDPAPFIGPAHRAGLKVCDQVGSVHAAEHSRSIGCDFVIAQGHEAGGHVIGQVSTMTLVPNVAAAIAPTPVVAAGGIATGKTFAAALALGAQAAVMGTRFLVCPESDAHPRYKERVLAASEESTIYSTLFDGGWPNAPHRALRTPFVNEWAYKQKPIPRAGDEQPVIGEMNFAGMRLPVTRFLGMPPDKTATGDIDSMALFAGQSAGLVRDAKPAAEIVREVIAEAECIISRRLPSLHS